MIRDLRWRGLRVARVPNVLTWALARHAHDNGVARARAAAGVRFGPQSRVINPGPVERIRIGDHAWISFNVAILKGGTIGEGAIVGAGSVVTKDVPPYVLCAGNPARVVTTLDANDAK